MKIDDAVSVDDLVESDSDNRFTVITKINY